MLFCHTFLGVLTMWWHLASEAAFPSLQKPVRAFLAIWSTKLLRHIQSTQLSWYYGMEYWNTWILTVCFTMYCPGVQRISIQKVPVFE